MVILRDETPYGKPFDADARLERECVAGAWLNPVEAHDAAVLHGVCGRSFSDPGCGALFAYLVTVGGLERQPDWHEAERHIPEVGGSFTAVEIMDLIVLNVPYATTANELVERVALRHQQRQEARWCLRRASALMNVTTLQEPIQRLQGRIVA